MVNKKQRKSERCPISGKVMIANSRLAEKRKDFINNRTGNDTIKAVYKCAHCSRWHISSMSPNEHKSHIQQMIRSQKKTGNIMQDVENRLNYLKNNGI